MPGGARVQLRPRAATLVAAGERYEAIAKQIGVNERTVRRWVAEPEFAAQVRAMQSEVIERATSRLSDSTARAAETLDKLLCDEDPRIRLYAAKEILSASSRHREQQADEDRLARVEALAGRLAQTEAGKQ